MALAARELTAVKATTWSALARRQQAYRELLAQRLAEWGGNGDGYRTNPAALCALAALADRADRHDVRMQRHLARALDVSELFDGRRPS